MLYLSSEKNEYKNKKRPGLANLKTIRSYYWFRLHLSDFFVCVTWDYNLKSFGHDNSYISMCGSKCLGDEFALLKLV